MSTRAGSDHIGSIWSVSPMTIARFESANEAAATSGSTWPASSTINRSAKWYR